MTQLTSTAHDDSMVDDSMVKDDSMVNLTEACRITGVTTERLCQLVDDGRVPAYLIENDLRFRARELREVHAE